VNPPDAIIEIQDAESLMREQWPELVEGYERKVGVPW